MTRGERGGERCHAHHHNAMIPVKSKLPVTATVTDRLVAVPARRPSSTSAACPGATCRGTTARSRGWRSRGCGRRGSRAASPSPPRRSTARASSPPRRPRPRCPPGPSSGRCPPRASTAFTPCRAVGDVGIGEQRAQRLARLAQRAPRGGVGRRVEPVPVEEDPRAGLVEEQVLQPVAGHPGRVQQVEGKRLPEQWARIDGGHLTSIGRQSGDRVRGRSASRAALVEGDHGRVRDLRRQQDAAVRELQAGLGSQHGEADRGVVGQSDLADAERLDRALAASSRPCRAGPAKTSASVIGLQANGSAATRRGDRVLRRAARRARRTARSGRSRRGRSRWPVVAQPLEVAGSRRRRSGPR